MNLHLSHDDKFLDSFIENQNKFSNSQNKYIVYSDRDKMSLVKNKLVEVVSKDIKILNEKIGDLSQYNVIYIHYLSPFLIKFVNSLKGEIKIVWIFWGADGFLRIDKYIEEHCLEPDTKTFYQNHLKLRFIWTKNPVWFIKNLNRFYRAKYILNKSFVKATQKINYFAHYIHEDYILIKNHTNFNAEFIDFNYLSYEQLDNTEVKKHAKEINILLGNSDAYTNNHLDVFSELSNQDLSDIKSIYCPLSYSKDNKYITVVIEKGKEYFNEKFVPMTDFLPKNDYYTFLGSISIGLFGMIRSQAAGNILTLLNQGSRVYMKNTNTLYQFLKQSGIIIFDIDLDLPQHIKEKNLSFLPESQMLKNKSIIEALFGEKAMTEKYNNLLNLYSE